MDFAQPKTGRAESVASRIILLKSVLLPRARDKTLDRHKLVSHIQLPNRRFVRFQDQSSPSSDDEYLYTLDQDSAMNSKTPLVNVKVNGVPIEMIVDTGASTDILDEDSFTKIMQCQTIELQPPTKRILPTVPSLSSQYSESSMQP